MSVAFTFPAIRARMGSTDYFQVAVSARDLASVAIPVNELTEWKQWSISERFQRELAMRRVHEELIPYLVRSSDRFFGSIIVLVYEPDVFEFESLDGLATGMGAAYRGLTSRMGFLTVSGGQLVALDGQHRLVALREIVAGRAEVVGEFTESIADDELCVVFVRHEALEKTRRIFNKVNQHARPTTKSDNIITSEDDGYAIVARWLVDSDPPLGLSAPLPPLGLLHPKTGEPLVEWRSTSLSQNQESLTTLNAVYQTIEVILDAHGMTNFGEKDRVTRPANKLLERAYGWCCEWWSAVLAGVDVFARAAEKPYLIPDLRRGRSPSSLLMRPIAHVALFRGLAEATSAGMLLTDAVRRTNDIDWHSDADHWRDVIVRANGAPIAKSEAVKLTGRLIAYLIAADRMSQPAVDRLRLSFAEAKGWDPTGSSPMPILPAPLPASA
ncbi:MAG TPA: DNA sulfur modification protein DndB [Ilumatobacteraceae bacterium]|nr:DNA sulfur modification protein DndB [Ilumatobacteraceae bacterium]